MIALINMAMGLLPNSIRHSDSMVSYSHVEDPFTRCAIAIGVDRWSLVSELSVSACQVQLRFKDRVLISKIKRARRES